MHGLIQFCGLPPPAVKAIFLPLSVFGRCRSCYFLFVSATSFTRSRNTLLYSVTRLFHSWSVCPSLSSLLFVLRLLFVRRPYTWRAVLEMKSVVFCSVSTGLCRCSCIGAGVGQISSLSNLWFLQSWRMCCAVCSASPQGHQVESIMHVLVQLDVPGSRAEDDHLFWP